MPHIHTLPGQHDHTVSAYIIRTDFDEPKIMFHKHKKLGRYIQFGGHIELNETPWQAISHELQEETGYSINELMILQPVERIKALDGAVLHPVGVYHNTHVFNEEHFHSDIGYAFIADHAPQAAVGVEESTDIRLLTRTELMELPADQTFESVRMPALFIFDTCLAHWERVDPTSFA